MKTEKELIPVKILDVRNALKFGMSLDHKQQSDSLIDETVNLSPIFHQSAGPGL